MFSNHFLNKLEQSQDEPYYNTGFPVDTSGKEPACQCRRCKRQGFNPQMRKTPWRRVWQPTPVFLPGESLAQRSLAAYSLWGHKGVGRDLATKQQQHSTHSLEIWVRQRKKSCNDNGNVQGSTDGSTTESGKFQWEKRLRSFGILLHFSETSPSTNLLSGVYNFPQSQFP